MPPKRRRKDPWELKPFKGCYGAGGGAGAWANAAVWPGGGAFGGPGPAPAPAAMRPTRTALWLRLALPLGLALVCPASVGLVSARAPIYVSSWAVRVSEGYREAERLARRFGFVNLGLVGGTRMDWRGRDWTRPRQMGKCLSGPLDTKNSQPTPASDSSTPGGHMKLTPGIWLGEDAN